MMTFIGHRVRDVNFKGQDNNLVPFFLKHCLLRYPVNVIYFVVMVAIKTLSTRLFFADTLE